MRNHTRTLILAAGLLLLAVSPAWAMYHPTIGRFMQRDPIGYPDGMNAYAGYHIMHGANDFSGLRLPGTALVDRMLKDQPRTGPAPKIPQWRDALSARCDEDPKMNSDNCQQIANGWRDGCKRIAGGNFSINNMYAGIEAANISEAKLTQQLALHTSVAVGTFGVSVFAQGAIAGNAALVAEANLGMQAGIATRNVAIITSNAQTLAAVNGSANAIATTTQIAGLAAQGAVGVIFTANSPSDVLLQGTTAVVQSPGVDAATTMLDAHLAILQEEIARIDHENFAARNNARYLQMQLQQCRKGYIEFSERCKMTCPCDN